MQAMPMEDPRDNLEKATRDQLWAFAKAMGVTEVREPMPKLLCEQILRSRGLVNIPIDAAPLGTPPVLGKSQQAAETVNAVDMLADLRRQYEQQQENPDPVPVDIEKMSFNELRSELKKRGVKLSRKDTLEVLKAKWHGQDAA